MLVKMEGSRYSQMLLLRVNWYSFLRVQLVDSYQDERPQDLCTYHFLFLEYLTHTILHAVTFSERLYQTIPYKLALFFT